MHHFDSENFRPGLPATQRVILCYKEQPGKETTETVRVLRHGKAVAKIIPAETEQKRLSWKRPGLRLVRPGASLSKAILEERRKSR